MFGLSVHYISCKALFERKNEFSELDFAFNNNNNNNNNVNKCIKLNGTNCMTFMCTKTGICWTIL